jgi:hypothetical protein
VTTTEPTDPPEEIYRTLAKARAVRWGYAETLDPADYHRLVDTYAADPNLRADVAVLWAAIRGTR